MVFNGNQWYTIESFCKGVMKFDGDGEGDNVMTVIIRHMERVTLRNNEKNTL